MGEENKAVVPGGMLLRVEGSMNPLFIPTTNVGLARIVVDVLDYLNEHQFEIDPDNKDELFDAILIFIAKRTI